MIMKQRRPLFSQFPNRTCETIIDLGIGPFLNRQSSLRIGIERNLIQRLNERDVEPVDPSPRG